jgi:hypothetical protein
MRSEIPLLPGLNTGTPDKPCRGCGTRTRLHKSTCNHYLYQRQYLAPGDPQCETCAGPITGDLAPAVTLDGAPLCEDCQDDRVAAR